MIRVTDEEVRSAKEGELLIVERSRKTPANPNRLKVGVYYLYNGVTKSLTSLLQLTGSIAWGQITGNLTSQTDLKTALDAKANDADISLVGKSNDYDDLDNKPSIPTKTSDITNDSGFITSSALVGYATEAWVALQGYVTNVVTALGYTPENAANKSTSVVTDSASNTKYPSVKAVFDWVTGLGYITSSAIKFKLLADLTNTSVNTNTSNVILGTVLIPANTITGNTLLEVETFISRANGGVSPGHRLILNTSPTFDNTKQVAVISILATAISSKGERTYICTTGQIRGYSFAQAGAIDDVANASSPSTLAVDWTVDQYLMTVVNNATGETTTHELTSVKVIKT